ncbi:hypothetical protein AVEN_28869-1 [Araneus ventricosus]|uniref:Uncharacterized protein n=1 Tax=Araneus ventricosus TaxID=182803 RepID=A0A4Y2P145_ARAVE|nr:hypothetical protein AVEN_28869-1 [Araneus ventricosus]
MSLGYECRSSTPKDNVSMVRNQDQDHPYESEEVVSTDLVSHVDAASALELALRYEKKYAAFTPTDVMFKRR